MKRILKRSLQGIFLAIAFLPALSTGFGRLESIYRFWAHSFALAPGLPGDYLRIAYYQMTLESCSLDSRIQFGSFFAHPEARIATGVYIGAYCILGRVNIGRRTQLASGVQILSGKHQHTRDSEGRMAPEHGRFETVTIGSDCWIGAGALVMADVGNGTTVGAGSVVVRPLPAGCIAVGNPARLSGSV